MAIQKQSSWRFIFPTVNSPWNLRHVRCDPAGAVFQETLNDLSERDREAAASDAVIVSDEFGLLVFNAFF